MLETFLAKNKQAPNIQFLSFNSILIFVSCSVSNITAIKSTLTSNEQLFDLENKSYVLALKQVTNYSNTRTI